MTTTGPRMPESDMTLPRSHLEHIEADHEHVGPDHGHELRLQSRPALVLALVLILLFMIVEVVGGLLSDSLALLADAGHMLTDAGAIGLALLAMWIASRPWTAERTFGLARTEVLAASLNILTLWLISGWVTWEAAHRIGDEPEVSAGLMTIVGAVGLAANLAVAIILRRMAGQSLNVQGAFLHVLGDLLGSVAVIGSGILILAFGWHLADPVASIVIAGLILLLSYRPAKRVFHVLIEGVPPHIDIYALCHDIEKIDGVTLVHDVHAWTITSGYDAISAHIMVDPDHPNQQAILTEAQAITRDRYQMSHITFQVESSADDCVEDHHIGHLQATSRNT